MRNILSKIKEMYKDTGYHKQFIILFIVVEFTELSEIIILPRIIEKVLDVEIPTGNIKGLIFFSILYMVYLIVEYFLVLKHCEIRCILERKIQGNLREKIFSKLQEVNTKFYDYNETGTILQFLNNDVNLAGRLFADIVAEMFFLGLGRFTIIAVFMMIVNVNVTLLILGLYLLGFLVTLFFNRKTIKLIKDIRKINIQLYSLINEGINGFLSIKILDIVKEKENELDEKLKEYMNCNDKLEKVISIYNNIFLFITSSTTCIILYKVGISIMSGIATYAQVEILLEYSGHLKYNFDWFSRHLTNINKSYISYSKILEFLNNANVEELEEGEELQEVKSIEFADVNFSYDDNQKNIKNFSLYIDSKKKVALTGRTGAGKTTVTGLLCRFYEPVTGQIKINGRDYREYSIKSLREKIGYVMQNIEIFPNTIVDNIRFVNENISREKIVEIFKKLKLHDRVMRLENGYDTNIYDNPDILSTRRKAIIDFCKGNGERVRCYYFR